MANVLNRYEILDAESKTLDECGNLAVAINIARESGARFILDTNVGQVVWDAEHAVAKAGKK